MSNLITQGLSVNNQSLILMGLGGDSSENAFSCNVNLISPVISASALVVVNVFEALSYVPVTNEIVPLPLNAQLASPNVSADAVVNVVVFSVADTLQDVVVGDSVNTEKQTVFASILQPTVTGEKKAQQKPNSGWPYDAYNTLGAGIGIPIGLVSGNKSPYVTIQFKICGDNFPCEEGIYQKASGLQSKVKIVINKIRHKIKKSNVKIKGEIIRQRNDSLNVEFLKLEKINV